MLRAGLIALLTLFMAGCSWVKPIPGAEKVVLLSVSEVSKCQKLGSTMTQTLDKVSLYNRDEKAIKDELIALAKNEAVRMQGDVVVAMSPLKDGTMQFGIYNCY